MRKKPGEVILALMLLQLWPLMSLAGLEGQSKPDKVPNVLIILMDDMGYGDIGVFGASDIRTPNIDRLASRGLTFTSYYAAAANCSPSRAGLLTGRLPIRYGVNDVFFPESFTGLPLSETTIADQLKEAGYRTHFIGKWHLGHREKYLPTNRGFDSYIGIPYSNDMHSPYLIKNTTVENFFPDQSQLTRQYTEEAIRKIKQADETPFLIILAHTMPHVPLYASDRFKGNSERGIYGDVIEELDWSVGEVVSTLRREGKLDNTFLFVTSDNGPWLEMEAYGGSSGALRGGKHSSFEGSVRVPAILHWPAAVSEPREIDDIATAFDLFPTIMSIVGLEPDAALEYDGTILPGLFRRRADGATDRVYPYFEKGEFTAFRKGNWKVKFTHEGLYPRFYTIGWPGGHGPHGDLLFDLSVDIGERDDLSEEFPAVLKRMKREAEKFFGSLGDLPPSLVIRGYEDQQAQKYRDEQIESLINSPN